MRKLVKRPDPSVKDINRFWLRVVKTNTCWWWRKLNGDGNYGTFSYRVGGVKFQIKPHRFAYEVSKGSAGDLYVLHSCDNVGCVNPHHLFLGTQDDNLKDAVKKGRIASGDNHYARKDPSKVNRWVKARGSESPKAKLTEADIPKIKEALKHLSRSEVAHRFGVTPSTISKVSTRRTWAHVD